MRTSRPVELCVSHEAIQQLNAHIATNPPRFPYKVEYFYFIMHYLHHCSVTQKYNEHKQEQNYFNLKCTFFNSVIPSSVARYIKYLQNGEFIESDNKYVKGEKSKHYRNANYGIVEKPYVLQPTHFLSKRILKACKNEVSHINRLPKHLQAMNKLIKNIEYDQEAAIAWIHQNQKDVTKANSYISAVQSLADPRFRFFKRNKTNLRVDTNFTNLKSELRQFIVPHYTNIDLKNSQPFLLAIMLSTIFNSHMCICELLSEHNVAKFFGRRVFKRVLNVRQNTNFNLMVNLSLFFNSTISGKFYEEFIKLFKGVITRKEVKVLMYSVMFSRNLVHQKFRFDGSFVPFENEKNQFASVYEGVYECIRCFKEKEHNKLAIFLQRLESHMFIDVIAKQLVEAGIVPITIHDSVMVPNHQVPKTLEIINQAFINELGVMPPLDIKPVNNPIKTIN